MRPRLTLSRALVIERTWPFFIDISVAAGLLAGFYAILWVAKFWFSSAIPKSKSTARPPICPFTRFIPLFASSSPTRSA
jgi:NitT/TauT family transport system permease protein